MGEKNVICPSCGHKFKYKKEKKEKRKPSEYNKFLGKEIKDYMKKNPKDDYKKAFSAAVKAWNEKPKKPNPKEKKESDSDSDKKESKKFSFF